MSEEQRLVGDFLDDARFARRDLADDRREYGRALVRDRGHAHRHVEGLERHVAVAFAERRFGLQHRGIDQPLDHDFGIRRHVEVDGDAFGLSDRHAGQAACDRQLVGVDRELLRTREEHDRRAAEGDRDRHQLLALAILEPVQVAARAADACDHAHREPVGRFERRAVSAHVLNAALGIARDAQRRGEIRRGVEARRRDRHRQTRKTAAGPPQIVARDHHLLARRVGDRDGRDRLRDRMQPRLADVFDGLAHAHRVDARRGRERAHGYGNVVAPAFRIDDVREEERAPLIFRYAAQELPAHQRMQLGVLVDGPVDADEKTLRLEVGKMLLEIEVRPAGRLLLGNADRIIGHDGHLVFAQAACFHLKRRLKRSSRIFQSSRRPEISV